MTTNSQALHTEILGSCSVFIGGRIGFMRLPYCKKDSRKSLQLPVKFSKSLIYFSTPSDYHRSGTLLFPGHEARSGSISG